MAGELSRRWQSALPGAATPPNQQAPRVTIQDLGSIGEFLAAIATIATLVYLAVQVRQNTRALRSSTFQNISAQMAQNVEPIVSHADVADLLAKGMDDPDGFTPGERIRFQSVLVMSFRRMEAVYIHTRLGSIDRELTLGFERSMLTILQSPGAGKWWKDAKQTFNSSFADHVDAWLAENAATGTVHPSMGFSLE